ncbi:tRNA threonylcarbamoyladenosine dehydratase [Clostridium vincentii]|uniref:tRNA threonylcarbamoyladenosine dehydratase n=1 Tax=Clostridium vincentii TaxID=52704 RepID=A0A2T0BA11_9CLOT|nr:tRNA threonylcarbamoyladenosine dehydratase [Clostridium vincentii]PRR80741.1 tRNA threonylcarbamoyladenosine dehydratase [Clostridium vincentii]
MNKMQHTLSRTELLVGEEGLDKLRMSKVVVFGIGGVGSFTVEALTRAGVGNLILIDDDTICLTNLNRQIHAVYETIGKVKVDVMMDRILSINKKCNVITHEVFVTKENMAELIPEDTDYVIDAIDTITAKIGLAEYCAEKDIRIISSMGTGNKMDPTQFKVADIYDTKVCPLARVMRRELRKREIKGLKVVYSEEFPMEPKTEDVVTCKTGCVCTGGTKKCAMKRQIPGSISFVPSVAGLIIGGEVIKDILKI